MSSMRRPRRDGLRASLPSAQGLKRKRSENTLAEPEDMAENPEAPTTSSNRNNDSDQAQASSVPSDNGDVMMKLEGSTARELALWILGAAERAENAKKNAEKTVQEVDFAAAKYYQANREAEKARAGLQAATRMTEQASAEADEAVAEAKLAEQGGDSLEALTRIYKKKLKNGTVNTHSSKPVQRPLVKQESDGLTRNKPALLSSSDSASTSKPEPWWADE